MENMRISYNKITESEAKSMDTQSPITSAHHKRRYRHSREKSNNNRSGAAETYSTTEKVVMAIISSLFIVFVGLAIYHVSIFVNR